jgi:hypothetical protein
MPATALLLLACSVGSVSGTRVVRVAAAQYPISAEGAQVDRLYVAPDGSARWDGTAVTPEPTACASGVAWRRTAVHSPRVDEYACRPVAGPRGERVLVGLAPGGGVAWTRSLAFQSGAHAIDLSLIGASPQALVLSDLEVLSPAGGGTLVPARVRVIAGEGRTVPAEGVQGAAAYVRSTGSILLFDADVTLLRRDGGLYRVDPGTGTRALVLPVTADLFGRYDRVEAIAVTPDGRSALLARRRSTRGPSAVSVAVVALPEGALLFEETHGDGHACFDPQVAAGPSGTFAFAYRDDTLARRVVVQYRLGP